eukprot:6977256-Lingulodinium_polyedra.AAC.1
MPGRVRGGRRASRSPRASRCAQQIVVAVLPRLAREVEVHDGDTAHPHCSELALPLLRVDDGVGQL